MYFKYGTYQHSASEAEVQVFTRKTYTDRGSVDRITKTLRISGRLIATSESTMATAIEKLTDAYSLNSRNALFYSTDSNLIYTHSIVNSETISGVRVMAIDFPEGGGVFATNRAFQVTLEADYPVTGSDNILKYQQIIRKIGTGGPRYVVVPLLANKPIRQMVNQFTETYAHQSGSAFGLSSYPNCGPLNSYFPLPLWPDLEMVDNRETTYIQPIYQNGSYTNYGIVWSYQFAGIDPF